MGDFSNPALETDTISTPFYKQHRGPLVHTIFARYDIKFYRKGQMGIFHNKKPGQQTSFKTFLIATGRFPMTPADSIEAVFRGKIAIHMRRWGKPRIEIRFGIIFVSR
jgi:hypothetical protein